MSANNQPIYSRIASIGSQQSMTVANTTIDMTSGTSYLLFTADATNGSFVSKLRLHATPGGVTSVTVLRLWLNNGNTTATVANNVLFDEITLPATTGSQTAATPNYEIPLNIALPAGYTCYATLGSASATGWMGTVVGGKY